MERILQGKAALVTGASRGLGKAIATAFADAGASVLLVARESVALTESYDALRQTGPANHAVRAVDLTDSSAAAACVDAAREHFGGLDILVNCAGTTRRGDFLQFGDADWHDGFALKFHACVRLCRSAWPALAERRGAILNVVGVSSRTPSADFTIGGAVNSALLNFTKALADLGGPAGVRVNAINPGYIHTDRLAHRIGMMTSQRAISADAARAELLASYGLQRFGQPEDVAQLAVFLASDRAAYIHGSTIDIDGGATRGL